MRFIDQGRGRTLVFIPGLQGRWEYARGTVDALSSRFRTLTFSLGDEPSAGFPFQRERGFDSYADQVAAVLDRTGTDRAIVCGLSFGGLVALKFAALRPERVEALVLASTPGPGWRLRRKHEMYARFPWVFGPLFLLEAPMRARSELKAAFPDPAARRAFVWRLVRTLATAPVSLTRMARRARLIGTYDSTSDCARIVAPTLVVTGEADLDHVVPVDGSSRYVELIAGARQSVLFNSGHQGTLTRPDAFAAAVGEFAGETTRDYTQDDTRDETREEKTPTPGRVA
jgi:pimeloyl-ACP methyl ester carboxylesterase